MTTSSATTPADPAYFISIRVWEKGARGAELVESSWTSDHILVAMIGDIIVASGGNLVSELEPSMIAQFESLASATAAAKRIQGATSGFSDSVSEAHFSVAIAITRGARLRPGNIDRVGSCARQLDQFISPGQVIVAEDLSEQLQSFPGVNLRSVGSENSRTESMIHELVWTPLATQADSEAVSQVDSRTMPAASGESSRRGLLPELKNAERTFESDDVPTLPYSPAQEEMSPWEVSPTTASDIAKDDLGDSAAVARSRLPIGLAVGGAAVLVIVLAFLLFFHRPAPGPSTPVEPAAKQVQLAAPAESPPRSESNTMNVSAASPTASENTHASASMQSATAKSAGTLPSRKPAQPKSIKKTETVSAQNSGACDGYFPDNIPFLLNKADQDSGWGKYSEARHEYQVVLCLDQSSARAKQGLHRLELIEKQQKNRVP